ncbi:MAG: hypothetical protein ABUL60_09280 [Myxococcales bacterium]
MDGQFAIAGKGKGFWLSRALSAGVGLAGVFLATVAQATPTTTGGQAYVNECAAAGVPTPPPFNYEDAWHQRPASQWKKAGFLQDPFISGESTGEVFYWESMSPAGVCIALPRSEFPAGQTPEQGPPTAIHLLGVICQGKVSGKACFWDQGDSYTSGGVSPFTTLGFGDGDISQRFAGGIELLGPGGDSPGGKCIDCHRGENVFIVHPASTLGLVPSRMPDRWVDPLVPGSWGTYPNPSSLFNPSQTDSCLSCHRQPIAGRFPEVSNQTGSYCGTILKKSFGRTMPPPPTGNEQQADFPPYDLLVNACNAAPGPADNSSMKMMSFDPGPQGYWSAQTGTLSRVTNLFTEGTASMGVNASGYVLLDSLAFNSWSLPVLGSRVDLDVYVSPTGQPQPQWLGQVQLFATIPSAQMINTYIGQVELTPLGTGWHTATFQLPTQVRTALGQANVDVRWSIAVNRPNASPAILLDNMRFAGTLGLPAVTPSFVLQHDFERGGTWEKREGAVTAAANSAARSYLGSSSLKVTLNGSGTGRVWTKPLVSPPPGATVSYRVYVPQGAPVTAIQPYVADKNFVWAQRYNTNLPRNAWIPVSAVVPANAQLPAQEIGVKIYLSAPYSGPIYIDAVQW